MSNTPPPTERWRRSARPSKTPSEHVTTTEQAATTEPLAQEPDAHIPATEQALVAPAATETILATNEQVTLIEISVADPTLPTTEPTEDTATTPTATTETVPTPLPAKPKRERKTKTPAEPKEKKLSALDAAAKVLAESGQMMTCKELIGTMAAKGYWFSPGGKTPEATLCSALLREIAIKGEQSRFVKAAPGRFAARKAE